MGIAFKIFRQSVRAGGSEVCSIFDRCHVALIVLDEWTFCLSRLDIHNLYQAQHPIDVNASIQQLYRTWHYEE